MKRQGLILRTTILCLIFSGVFCCTQNPFSTHAKIETRNVTGKVALSDDIDPSLVYVWLEEIQVGDYTDEAGEFSIPMPPADVQDLGDGLSGDAHLYFYLSNYKIVKKIIRFVDGEIEKDQPLITQKGHLRETVILPKLLSVNTSISYLFEVNEFGTYEYLQVHIDLLTFSDTVRVSSMRKSAGVGIPAYRTGIIFEPLDGDPEDIIIYNFVDGWMNPEIILPDSSLNWTVNYDFSKLNNFPHGEYRVYPYLAIDQPRLSQNEYFIVERVRQNMGKRADLFGYTYHLLPMKRNDAPLKIPFIKPEM